MWLSGFEIGEVDEFGRHEKGVHTVRESLMMPRCSRVSLCSLRKGSAISP